MMRARAGLALCMLLFAQTALAQSRVVVRPFNGPGGSRAREALVTLLSDQKGIELVTDADAQSASEELSADLSTSDGRVAVARKLNVSAFIQGEVRKHGRNAELGLVVMEGKTGALLDKATLRAKPAALPREVHDRFMRELGAAVFQAQPPPADAARRPVAKPVPVASAPQTRPKRAGERPLTNVDEDEKPEPIHDESEPAEEAEASAARPQAFELDAMIAMLMRDYSYNDALVKLGEHTLSPTPALRLGARWYPGAHFTSGAGANIGLDVFAQMMWPVDAKGSAETFKTNSVAFGLAARYRVPLGEHQLGFFAGYGQQRLSFAKSSGVEAAVPNVAYSFVRLGADSRFALAQQFALKVGAAYLAPLGYGEVADKAWFPHASGGGFEAALGVGYTVSPLVELDLGLCYARYFLSLKPELGDTGVTVQRRIAGGLNDQFFTGQLGVTLRP
jgi:hypothetical protein